MSQLPPRYARPRRIGQGGMGDIFCAEDTSLDRVVAVKVMADRFAADDGVRARFTREALAAARVSAAPHTVTIFDVGEWQGRPFIVMEYLPGGSLADRLTQDGAQETGRVLRWLEGAALALDAAHRHGIVHRDVKPANLLLDAEGEVAVADFGIARAAGMDSLTQAGTVLGTAGYLSPEQARGEPATPASDRYALGVVAFELLTGKRPFQSDSTTAEAAAHAGTPPPPISRAAPWLPAALDTVFARILDKRPDARHESCRAFVADLRSALRSDARTTRVIPAAAPTAPRPVVRRRRAWPALGLAALVLGLAGAALAAVLLSNDTPRVEERTVERTVTRQGERVTVTATTEAAPTTTPATAPAGSASELNDQGFRKMQAGDYEGALPLLESAVSLAQGTGDLTEAYASYNLAFTRFALGECDGVVELLDRSEAVQGKRKEIMRLRHQAEKRCGD